MGITYKLLVKKLNEIGFVEKAKLGSHLLFVNEKFDSNVVLPSSDGSKIVAEYFLKSLRKNLIEKGALTEEQFHALMIDEK